MVKSPTNAATTTMAEGGATVTSQSTPRSASYQRIHHSPSGSKVNSRYSASTTASTTVVTEPRVLECVSSLRDSHSGSITEVKVWSSALPSPSPPIESASSPPVEPVSSQSSSSADEESSKERPKYRLPKQRPSPELHRTPSSGKDVIVQTVSSLREAASASLTDLKEWAHNHTRSDPIQTVSSSSSSASSCASVVESKPPGNKGAARVVRTIKPPSIAAQDNASSSSNRYALAETVSSFRDVASETVSGIKEWAAKLPKKDDSVELQAADETKRLYSKPQGEPTASPQRAARTLYGAETGYQTVEEFPANQNHPPSSSSPRRKLSCSPQLKLVQDLVSPFLVCSNGGGTTRNAVQDDNGDQKVGNVNDDDEPRTYHIDMSQKEKTDELSREAAWSTWNPIIGAVDRRAESFDESLLTYDSDAEEQEQIRRMTSWGTIGTSGTQNTMLTIDTSRTLETADGPMVEATMMVQDDSGHTINPVLLEKAMQTRDLRKRKGRKRLVKFDYPPISSLRECPRTDPEDLPNLFFTEEELDQIEDDRCNTKIADDVEIVCISSIKSSDDSLSDGRDIVASSRSSLSGGSFSRYASSPKLRGKPRSRSPFLRKRPDDAPGFGLNRNYKSPTPPTKFSNDSTNSSKDQRLIKGVQIFLRERSIGS